jgi:hypothetical protein
MLNEKTVFPDNTIRHRIFDDISGGIKDGTYLMCKHDKTLAKCNGFVVFATIKDNKLISSSGYEEGSAMPHTTYYFEYDDPMIINKEIFDDGYGKRLHRILK